MKYSSIRLFLDKLPKKGIRSFFVAGSMPEEIEKGHDIDVFIVINKDSLNEVLDTLKKESEAFCKENNCTYTFFRGPIKIEEKPLIHYVIYTNGKKDELNAFQHEPPQVVNNILKQHDLIFGDSPEKFKSEMNLSEDRKNEREEYMLKKAEPYFKKKEITYRSWQKKENNWDLLSETVKLTPWQVKALYKYFKGYKPKK